MSDDKLLSALGRVAAGQTADRERWEALPADADATREDEHAELARRLFAPASDASLERLTRRVAEQIGVDAHRPATVVPLRRRVLKWAGIAAVPLAAAAAILMRMGHPSGDLPSYTLSVSGGVRDERGADTRAATDPIPVAPRSRVVLLARPDASASGDVHTATFLMRAGAPVEVPSVCEASAKGALRVTVLGDDLAKAAGGGGLFDLVLVVDRSADADRRALTSDARGGHRDWARFTVPVRMADTGR